MRQAIGRDAGRHDVGRYTRVAIGLHWLIALGILVQLALGIYMTRVKLPTMQQFEFFQLHKSVGITVLLAVVLRVLWRLTHRPPALPGTIPPIERGAAHGAHLALYALMLAMPLTGWAVVSSSAFNIPTVLYGVIPWPHLPVLSTLADKAPVEAAFKTAHGLLGYAILAVVALHVAATLRHLLRRDGLFGRMSPLPRSIS